MCKYTAAIFERTERFKAKFMNDTFEGFIQMSLRSDFTHKRRSSIVTERRGERTPGRAPNNNINSFVWNCVDPRFVVKNCFREFPVGLIL
jgi:hypothetical protein